MTTEKPQSPERRPGRRYTNTTFTKRPVHEVGDAPRRAESEPAQCPECGAVYAKRRWTLTPAPPLERTEKPKPEAQRPRVARLCPGCRQIAAGTARGFVNLRGSYLTQHDEQIALFLRNEAARAAEDNPLARIIGIDKSEEGWLVRTTTAHLAQRLGQALGKAFAGSVRYAFSHENRTERVTWQRD